MHLLQELAVWTVASFLGCFAAAVIVRASRRHSSTYTRSIRCPHCGAWEEHQTRHG